MKTKKRGLIIGFILLALLFVGLYILENTLSSSTMLLTILKKGVISR